jgi:hypothetical protein
MRGPAAKGEVAARPPRCLLVFGAPALVLALIHQRRGETVRKGVEWRLDRTFGWHTTAKTGLVRPVFRLVGLQTKAYETFRTVSEKPSEKGS